MNNPYVNALFAFVYIVGVATFMHTVPEVYFDIAHPVFVIALLLSLLVFSVALMGFLFFFRPLVLLCDKKFNESLMFFVRTLMMFGVFLLFLVIGIIFI